MIGKTAYIENPEHPFSQDNFLKYFIFIWLFTLCLMDHFYLPNLGTRLLTWGMNGLLFCFWFTRNIVQKRGFVPFNEKGLSFIVYLFLFWGCVSIFLSKHPSIYGMKQMGHFLIVFLDSYIFYDFFSRSKKNIHFFIKVATALVLFVSIWATIESFFKFIQGEQLFKNIYAGFGNQNFLGYFLFLFIPLMLSYYFINSPLKGKYIGWRVLFFLLLSYTFCLSSSRSAWNGFFFVLLFLLSRKSKILRNKIVFLTIVISISIYLFVGGHFYQNIWQKIYAGRASWGTYWGAVAENPIWGRGLGVGPGGRNAARYHAHNLYLGNATEMGIFSVFIVLAFYFLFIRSATRTAKVIKDPQMKAIILGVTAIFFGHLIYNLTDILGIFVSFRATSISFFPYILLALPPAIKNIYQREQRLKHLEVGS